MLKKLLRSFALLTFALLFWQGSVLAQSETISGVVVDEEGNPIPGITVLVQGSSLGTATNVDGEYTLEGVPANAEIIFRGVGLASKIFRVGEIPESVELVSQEKSLDAVVVSAVGFERTRDQIASSSSNINGSSLIQSGEPNLLNAMSGKASGINLVQNSGDPGAGSRIVIRGVTTIFGDLSPLIVIDGTPMFNDSFYGDGSTITDGVSQQNRLNDINPNDIASMEVLKGASAAALWGARAANGVIIITTKKGAAGKSKNWSVNLNFSAGFDEINKKVPLQKSFGQGQNGRYGFTTNRIWGDRIANRVGGTDNFITNPADPGYVGVFFPTNAGNSGSVYYGIANGTAANPSGGKNDRRTFDMYDALFRTGATYNSNVSVGTNDEKGSFFASFSDMRQYGTIKNNSDYRRNTARVNITRYLGKKVSVSLSSGYTKTFSNRVQMGSNLSGLFLGGLRTPPDFNLNDYSGVYTNAQGVSTIETHRSYRAPLGVGPSAPGFGVFGGPGFDNPRWMMQNLTSSSEVDRIIGNLEVNADPFTFLTLTGRVGLDSYVDNRSDYSPIYSGNVGGAGRLIKQTFNQNQLTLDLIAKFKFNITDAVVGSVFVGTQYNERRFSSTSAQGTGIINSEAPPLLSNFPTSNLVIGNNSQVLRTYAYYASANFGILDQVFVNFSGRFDSWSSFDRSVTNTFFFPSVDVAWQFSKIVPENSIFTFGKLRVTYGQVGRGPDPYFNRDTYSPYVVGTGWGELLNGAGYGGAFARGLTAGNPNIRPEIKTEYEAGLDLRFLNDRLSLSTTIYYNEIKDAILFVPRPPTSGYTSIASNGAQLTNRGLELELSGEVIRAGAFSWVINANYSRNINNVVSLLEGVRSVSLGLEGFGMDSRAIVGNQMGTLFGVGFLRSADTKQLVLDANGFPQLDPQPKVLGDPNPAYRLGIGSTFNYKGFSLSFLFDGAYGQKVWNGTKGALYEYGTHQDTEAITSLSNAQATSLRISTGQLVSSVYPANADGSYTVRGRIYNFGAGNVFLDESWYRGGVGSGFNNNEVGMEDGSWTRLRQLTFSYTFAQDWFKKATKMERATLSFTGRNLLLWTNYSGIDPDTNLTGSGNNSLGLDYFNNPATRSFIFSLNLTF